MKMGIFFNRLLSERLKRYASKVSGVARFLALRVFYGRQDASSGKNPLKKETVTIILLPNDSTRGKHFMIPLRAYKAARYAAIPLLIVFLYVIVDYSTMAVKVSETYKLQRENTTQKIELQTLSSKIGELEDTVSKLRVFDKKLRIIANLEIPAADNNLGMGGATDEDYFLTIEDKKEKLVDKLHSDINQIKLDADTQEKSFTELQEFFMKQASMLTSTPSVWPARGWLTSDFGMRRDPFTGRIQMHKGIDIANKAGADVLAPGDGIVTKSSVSPHLGRMVEVSHGYGMKTTYGHLSESYVRVGQRVKRGSKIAAIGSTGKSTGPHLHYEVVVNGISVDPRNYILN
ncbi:MAG: M23 family metallopeptidase [Thermodesulfobacteriota bacterium]